MDKTEARRFQRYDTIQKIFYRTDSHTPYKHGFTRNVSRNGLLMKSTESLSLGDTIEILIKINETDIHFKGQCMHCIQVGEKEFQTGILISKINASGAKIFRLFIDALEKAPVNNHQSPPIQDPHTENIFQRISGEHKIITQHVMTLQKMMSDKDSSVDLTEVAMALDLMRRGLETHFSIEEKLLFKIGLIHLPVEFHECIHELSQEHGLLNHHLDRVIISVQAAIKERYPWDEDLAEAVTEFLDQLKEHAKKEIVDLFPALENNAAAKAQCLLTVHKIITP